MKPRIDYTTINNYLICPRRVEFTTAGARHSISSAAVMGQVFHYALAELYRSGGSMSVEEAQQLARQSLLAAAQGKEPFPGFDREGSWNGEIRWREDLGTAQDIVSEALQVYLSKVRVVPDAVELSLETDIGDCVLHGRIDAVMAGRVIDWKLCGVSAKPSPLQSVCYAILVGGPCKFEFHMLRKARSAVFFEVLVERTVANQEFILWVRDHTIIPAAKAIAAGHFPANPTSQLCGPANCDFFDLCVGQIKQNRTQQL